MSVAKHRRTFVVTVEHDGSSDDAFDALFAEYLTTPDYPFLGDYGPEAWGGYDGPLVHGVQVSVNGIIVGRFES